MVRLRVLSALVGIPLVVVLIFVGKLPFTFAVLVVAFTGLWELSEGAKKCGIHIVKEVAFPCIGIAILGSHWARMGALPLLSLLASVWWLGIFGSMLFHILRTNEASSEAKGERVISIAATVFAIAYLSLFAFLILLRDLEVSVSEKTYPVGRDLVLLAVVSVWVTDSVAFFFGRAFGRKPLAPHISPGKTLEGSVAGTIAGFVVAWIFAWVLISFGSEMTSQVWLSLVRPIPFALLALALGTLGQVGDLGKSVLKRSLGVKDFGAIIPGHGGVLDRFDSLLATTPLVYLYACWALR